MVEKAVQVLVIFSIFTNYMRNNLLELNSKMIKFANPIKLFKAMKKQARRCACMKCVIYLWILLFGIL